MGGCKITISIELNLGNKEEDCDFIMGKISDIVKLSRELREGIDQIFLIPIEDLELTVRCINKLRAEGDVYYIGDLVQLTERQIMKMPSMGERSINEIRNVLSSRKLSLGMSIKNWEIHRSAENQNGGK